MIIGRDEGLLDAQHLLLRFAQADAPVLITGETGVGKELFARALYLLSERRKRSYFTVNCAKFQDSQLLASELFGHRKGSFTGAVSDRPGVFEEAEGGVVLLDEIAELAPAAQAMLLRVLGEAEVVRVGENKPRRVDIRVLAATARDLPDMVQRGEFRRDLYYRLRFLRLHVPPLRHRGQDWALLVGYYLDRLNERFGAHKHLTDAAMALLAEYPWPGNARELSGLVEVAFHTAEADAIEPRHFERELLDHEGHRGPIASPAPEPAAARPPCDSLLRRIVVEKRTFWEIVYGPFMDRELNRAEVTGLVRAALQVSGGSYKRLLPLFGIADEDYLKFMDFLRHHRLKPGLDSARATAAPAGRAAETTLPVVEAGMGGAAAFASEFTRGRSEQ